MRSIDAESVKAIIRGPACIDTGEDKKYVCELIDELPTVNGWISVKDRLPDKDGLYLVYGMSEAMKTICPDCVPIWLCTFYYDHGGWYSLSEAMAFDYITYWMPLPELPKE